MISATMIGSVVEVGTGVPLGDVRVTLDWCEIDPVAFTMSIELGDGLTQQWTMARELLLGFDALTSIGFTRGDVVVAADDELGIMTFCFNPPNGHGHLELPLEDVDAFIRDTIDVCGFGEEDYEGVVDELLELIFEGEK